MQKNSLNTPLSHKKQLRLESKFNEALSLHQSNKLEQARSLYEDVLKINPQHSDTLHLLGLIFLSYKQFDTSLDLINQAITLNPNYAGAYSNRGIVLQELHRYEEALESYDSAIAINPKHADTYSNRGNILQILQRYDEALESYTKAITLNANHTAAYSNRGNTLKVLHRLEEALESYNKAISINPNLADIYANRGNVLQALPRYEEALESYTKAMRLNPNLVDLYLNHGNALQALQRYEEALESYNQAITLNPNDANAYSNCGNALQALKRYEEALESYNQAITLNPNYTGAYSNRGNVLQALQRYDEALGSYNQAIILNPNYADAYANGGNALQSLQRYEEALKSYNQAITLNPNHASAYSNRGYTLQTLRRYDEALENYNKAIKINPNYSDAYWNKALLLLLLGDFQHGFELYEWRWSQDNFTPLKRNFTQPLWLGKEDINGKTLLIYTEQGLGDTLQFCRYLKRVQNLGAKIIFEVGKPLYSFLQHLQGIDQCILLGDPLPTFDYHCPLLSLALAFKTTLIDIPNTPSLKVDNRKVNYWKGKLKNITKPKIGIVWSGSTIHKNDHNRSITLETLVHYLPQELEYISLQKELRAIDKQTLAKNSNIHFFGDELNNFTDTAGLCECMDLIISVDTSVAHLSCTLNKKTIILLPFAPDWRWLDNRNDSPWYPSAHLLRQTKINDWDACLVKLTTLLHARY